MENKRKQGQGFISFGEEYISIGTTLIFWVIQAIVLWTITFACFMIRKIGSKLKEGKE